MNKSSKITALLFVLILVFSLTACSGGSDDNYDSDHGESYYDNEDEESSVVLAAELSGTWSSERGNILELDFDNETYYYETFYGRGGAGECGIYDGRPMMDFDGFLYDFELNEDGLVLRRNGSSTDESVESLDGMAFTRNDNVSAYVNEISDIAGYWTNNNGESLYIEDSDSTYVAQTAGGAQSVGTVGDDHNGKGIYLYLNGKAYIGVSLDEKRLKFYFVPTDIYSPDGTFECVFYRDGEIEANTNLENAKYWCDEFGGVWYYDGIGITYLGDNYTIGEDSSELYDEYGNYIRGLW